MGLDGFNRFTLGQKGCSVAKLCEETAGSSIGRDISGAGFLTGRDIVGTGSSMGSDISGTDSSTGRNMFGIGSSTGRNIRLAGLNDKW